MLRIFRAIPQDSIRLLVFDLDGTLIDSTEDLCNSVNATLREFNRAELEKAQITSYIGDGAQMLVKRALFGVEGLQANPESGAGEDEHLLASAMRYFLDYYRAHKLDYTFVYEGVLEALGKIQPYPGGGKRQMAVLTNKPVGPAKAICDALGLGVYLFEVYGGDSFLVKKPDPLGLNTLMDEAGVKPHETLMVGDSSVDIQTARNAGVWSLGCSYGLAPLTLDKMKPDLLVDHPMDWIEAFA